MTWARLDDAFTWHPKVLAAGNAAVGAWVRCLTHCCASRTDGFVAEAVARAVATPREIRTLTAAGLWRPVRAHDSLTVTGRRDTARRRLPDVTVVAPGTGYLIPDFLHYHRARSEAGEPSGDPDADQDAQHCAHSAVRTGRAQDQRGAVRTETARHCAPPLVPPPPDPDPIPAQPVPEPLPPSTLPPHPDPDPTRPAQPEGGREVPAPQGGPDLDPDAVARLEARLVCCAWHLRQGRQARLRRAAALLQAGLTVEAIDQLWPLARAQAREPAALFARWVDGGTWRDVLADQDLAAREQQARSRVPTTPNGEIDLTGLYDHRTTTPTTP